jgi:hypothetical protein
MMTDLTLRNDIEAELEFDSIDAAGIGVDCLGIDTLTHAPRVGGALRSQFMQPQMSHRSKNFALRSTRRSVCSRSCARL